MKIRCCVTAGVLATMLGGCNPIDLDPVEPEAQDTEQASGPGPNAIAMSWAQAGFEPADHDPEALILFFSSEAQECADPLVVDHTGGQNGGQGAGWQIYIGVPSDRVQPGVIPLDTAHVHFIALHEWWPSGEVSGVLSNGFPETVGTLEIVSLDAASVSVKLALQGLVPSDGAISGDYTASLCP